LNPRLDSTGLALYAMVNEPTMRPDDTYPRCIFCGEKADSREHAIPKWMSKRLGIKEMMGGRSGGGLAQPRHSISFASFRARIFCTGCNTHFKHLEDKVIPLIVPMATGRHALSLGEEGQTILALWASKTAMALLAAFDRSLGESVPRQHRDSVRYSGLPPANGWVGYYAWKGRTNLFVSDNVLSLALLGGSVEIEAYGVMFSFRRLAFKVVGFIDPVPQGYAIGIGSHPIRQVWPVVPSLIQWPPPAENPLTEADWQNITVLAPLIPVRKRTPRDAPGTACSTAPAADRSG
jgi:hypothetical protein